jgi:hypothetical protein
VQGRGAKSFADDLVTGRGAVLSRAPTTVRSVEAKPSIGRFVFFLFFLSIGSYYLCHFSYFNFYP